MCLRLLIHCLLQDVSEVKALFVRDYDGATVFIDWSAPSLGTTNCIFPP